MSEPLMDALGGGEVRRQAADLDTTGLRPAWVITGGQVGPDRFRVIASRKLSRSELRYELDTEEPRCDDPRLIDDYQPWVITSRRLSLTCHMRVDSDGEPAFILIEGASYQACMAHLFERWSPDSAHGPDRPARPALPGAPA